LPFVTAMAEVCEINDIEELAGYRLAWNSWLATTPRAAFVNTFDWLENYWRHFGRDLRLRALVVRSSGVPIGILPLCIRSERHGLHSVRVLTYPLESWGSWYGPVGSNPAVTMLAALEHIRRSRRDWDSIDLPATAPPSHDSCRVARSLRVVGMLSRQTASETNSRVHFAGDWNDYLAHRPRKVRHEIRRVLRRVFGDAEVEYIRHRPAPAREGDGDPRWDLFAMCQQVALASWQATSTTGTALTHERVRHFLRDAHVIAARNGMVDMNLLLVDGRPAAFAYNYHFHGRLSAVRVGYDPSLGIGGLGTALLLRSIEDSFARRDESLDLGPGDAPFQRRLRTRAEASYRVSYAPLGSWRSQLARFSQWASLRRGSTEWKLGRSASASA
jgi:CelD/BcsL family acetyltransferase involved in cellulose biosynthesis